MSKKEKDILHMTLYIEYSLESGIINIEEITEDKPEGIVLSFTPVCVDERLVKSLDVKDMEYLLDCFEPPIN